METRFLFPLILCSSGSSTLPNMRKLVIIASLPLLITAVRFLPLNRLPSTCVFYHVMGYPCPTCGMTRATIALTHLDFQRAVVFHPLAVVFAAALTVIWGMAVYEMIARRPTVPLGWIRIHAVSLVLWAFGLLFVFGALRIAALAGSWWA